MAANIDIKKSSRIRLTKDGYRAERIAMVSGVAGTAAQVLFNAINDSQLPDIGDAHPEISSITLQELDCQPAGGGQYRVTMAYYKDSGSVSGSSNAESRANTGLSVEETSLDVNGASMDTVYVTQYGNAIIRERFTAEVERPRINFEFEYTDSSFPNTDINTYLGKINSTAWNGYAAGTVLCSGIQVDQNGTNYRIRYSFAYRSSGWQFEAKTSYPAPLLRLAAEPDNDLDISTGTKLYTVYRTVDFTSLGFTFNTVGYVADYDAGRFNITGSDVSLTTG